MRSARRSHHEEVTVAANSRQAPTPAVAIVFTQAWAALANGARVVSLVALDPNATLQAIASLRLGEERMAHIRRANVRHFKSGIGCGRLE